jgi:D-glycero-alpha-D-manno-heptose-7-phosphate kinase
VDLAGRTLDIWPLYLFHPGAVTVDVAIDRRVWCRVEPVREGVRIESKDALVAHQGGSLEELLERESAPLAAFVLRALGISTGVKVTTRSRVPSGSGLGASSALAVAVAAAGAAAAGRELPVEELWPLVRDAEAQCLGRPVGIRDALAAIHGGLLAVHLEPGCPRVERLAVDAAAVEECLLLASSGATGAPGRGDWEVFRKHLDGDAATREGLAEIAAIAAAVVGALIRGRLAEVPELLAAEWEVRKRLAPGVTTPEIDHIAAIARECGAVARACGPGGGGVVAIWAAPGERGGGPREALDAALKEAGIPAFPFRADLQGLEVEVE